MGRQHQTFINIGQMRRGRLTETDKVFALLLAETHSQSRLAPVMPGLGLNRWLPVRHLNFLPAEFARHPLLLETELGRVVKML